MVDGIPKYRMKLTELSDLRNQRCVEVHPDSLFLLGGVVLLNVDNVLVGGFGKADLDLSWGRESVRC